METFSEQTPCLICFEIIPKQIVVPTNASAKILKNCKTHLHSTITKETLKDVQLKNENSVPLCKSCFDSASELTQLSKQLETVQKEISELTVTFNLAVFYRRSQVYNSQNVNSSSIIELNVACLPANTFLTKEVHQNVEHFNEKRNSNIIIDDDDSPDDNIEITDVKFESCDLRIEDLPEQCQQTTASVAAEILFSNESQDYNQTGLESTMNLPLKREVSTTGENETVDSAYLNEDEGQDTMSELDLMKSIRMPQIELKRIKIDGLKVKVPSTSSCQQKSQPRRQLLKNMKHEDNEFANSNSVSSNAMKAFNDKGSERNIHHGTHNTGEKPGFTEIGILTRHESSHTHTAEKPFKCNFCEKSFAQKISLQNHEAMHTGEKPYKCSFCLKEYALRRNLKVHERNHTAGKPHECSFCKRRFAALNSMKVHERIHTGEKPYECSFCKMRFLSFCSCQVHESRYHTGIKPFKCRFCDKSFIVKYSCQVHERTHTGEKPYKCLYCEKTFASISHRNRHQNTHKSKQLSSAVTC